MSVVNHLLLFSTSVTYRKKVIKKKKKRKAQMDYLQKMRKFTIAEMFANHAH